MDPIGYEDPMISRIPGHKLASDGTDNHLVLWDREKNWRKKRFWGGRIALLG